MATALDDVVRVLAGELPLAQQRARAWAAVQTQADARKAARVMGLTQADAVRALKLRQQRADRRAAGRDTLARRKPMSERWLQRAIQNAYNAAGFRGATHGHSVTLTVGDEPGASSSTAKTYPRAVGLPNSYDYPVTQSAHAVTFARDWLTAVKLRGAAWVSGALVLALATEPDARGHYAATWVRQGAGTSLVVVHGTLTRHGEQWRLGAKQRKAA